MDAVVYLFSKFSGEALLFEGLAVCVLLAVYSAYWVVQKRRFGVFGLTDQKIPSGLVKTYLNELLSEAHMLRTQLFGLLGSGVVQAENPEAQFQQMLQSSAPEKATTVSSAGAIDPGFAAKLKDLETRLASQTQAADALTNQKKSLESELEKLRSQTPAVASSGGSGSGEVNELKSKIKSLEERLAEYSVIEDDLANLKRLQQENQQLKSQLVNGGAGGTTATANAPTPNAAAPVVQAPAAAQTASTPTAQAPATQTPAASTAPASAPPAKEPAFEKLVDKVEASLKADEPTKPAATPTATDVKTENKAEAKPDEDLLAEFERMLNM